MAKAKESEAAEPESTAETGSLSKATTVQKTDTVPRKILKSDFQKVGVEDQDAVEFTPENNFTAEVSEAAADHLVEKDAFKRV